MKMVLFLERKHAWWGVFRIHRRFLLVFVIHTIGSGSFDRIQRVHHGIDRLGEDLALAQSGGACSQGAAVGRTLGHLLWKHQCFIMMVLTMMRFHRIFLCSSCLCRVSGQESEVSCHSHVHDESSFFFDSFILELHILNENILGLI